MSVNYITQPKARIVQWKRAREMMGYDFGKVIARYKKFELLKYPMYTEDGKYQYCVVDTKRRGFNVRYEYSPNYYPKDDEDAVFEFAHFVNVVCGEILCHGRGMYLKDLFQGMKEEDIDAILRGN